MSRELNRRLFAFGVGALAFMLGFLVAAAQPPKPHLSRVPNYDTISPTAGPDLVGPTVPQPRP